MTADRHPTPARSDDPEYVLALSYAPPSTRPAIAAVFALDDRLADVVRTTREPMVGQMRLAWWHAALCALDTAPPPAEPVLRALHAEVLPYGVTGASLANMIDGWEALLAADGSGPEAVEQFASMRGGVLFETIAHVLSAHDAAIATAGRAWALADLARHLTDPAARAATTAAARAALPDVRWSRPARLLGALTLLARFDLADPSPPRAGPRRVARLGWLRLTGR